MGGSTDFRKIEERPPADTSPRGGTGNGPSFDWLAGAERGLVKHECVAC